MTHNESKKENDFLHNWKLKLSILAAIVVPTITATGSFYGLDSKNKEQLSQVNAKIAALELQSQRQFVDKDTVKELRQDMKDMRHDMQAGMDELKFLIIKRSK